MSEGPGEPPADVRSFLPRPGEPVAAYAERLRALHRDLTLVLQAVERGLAEAARSQEDDGERDHEHELIEIVPSPPPERVATRRRGPRVEVMPPRGGAAERAEGEERRGTAPPAPAGLAPLEPPAPARPFPPRPSAAQTAHGSTALPAEPAWVHRPEPAPARVVTPARAEPSRIWTESFTAPSFPDGAATTTATATARPTHAWLPGWVIAALVAGWLVALALAVVVAFGLG